ncbi:SAF domain-containing protein [Paenibacillus polygoni]|uniref:SAF domain-containing protein n=1 Tax=Paenibacillus polygoni TaxID=3050112 RepID=A0ABY8WXL2_9BACL|nr:SAF domain-containing protein [Paenibacillus polygoni]WIV17822.1 SAF domain-containing protein [Paenibacillus polygoni]
MSKLRRQSKKMIYAGLAGAGAASLFLGSFMFYDFYADNVKKNKQEAQYELKLGELTQQLKSEQKNSKKGYVAARDVGPGTLIQNSDVKAIQIPADQSPANLMDNLEDIRGTVAKIELKTGTVITEAMVYQDEPTPADLRNREISVIKLPSVLSAGEMVDVRIQFPTGQDYIVLSKKKVDKLNGSTMWFTLTEEEILTLSSAMVDAYLHKASLYSLSYVEPEFQERAIPTYPANEKVLQLIEVNPNIVKHAEQALAKHLRGTLESALASSQTNVVSESIEQDLLTSRGGGISSSGESWHTDQDMNQTSSESSNEAEVWKESASEDPGNSKEVYGPLAEQNQILSQPGTTTP